MFQIYYEIAGIVLINPLSPQIGEILKPGGTPQAPDRKHILHLFFSGLLYCSSRKRKTAPK
jgi:hypothetical protein